MRPLSLIIACVAAALALAACGEETIDADSAAESVTNVVSEQTGFEPKDVECPDDAKAETGQTFECTFTGPDADYVADVTVGEIDGEDAALNIKTHPVDE